jgi:hypothetical protein
MVFSQPRTSKSGIDIVGVTDHNPSIPADVLENKKERSG